ncbi:hypothetical protein [Vibrio crassostreae]|uniref:hypothetical protein n=1 Tax=Vibrio crassostreae TaxID=246167 RepID=UPI001B31738D|nr:hypothetical protein [Vibrio crassostreae]
MKNLQWSDLDPDEQDGLVQFIMEGDNMIFSKTDTGFLLSELEYAVESCISDYYQMPSERDDYNSDRLLNYLSETDVGIGLITQEDFKFADMCSHPYFKTICTKLAYDDVELFFSELTDLCNELNLEESSRFSKVLGISEAVDWLIDLDEEETFFDLCYKFSDPLAEMLNTLTYEIGDPNSLLEGIEAFPLLVKDVGGRNSTHLCFQDTRDTGKQLYIDTTSIVHDLSSRELLHAVKSAKWSKPSGYNMCIEWSNSITVTFPQEYFSTYMPSATFKSLESALVYVSDCLKDVVEMPPALEVVESSNIEFDNTDIFNALYSAMLNFQTIAEQMQNIVLTDYRNLMLVHQREADKCSNLMSYLQLCSQGSLNIFNQYMAGEVYSIKHTEIIVSDDGVMEEGDVDYYAPVFSPLELEQIHLSAL